MARDRDPRQLGVAGATGLVGEAPRAGTASCLRLALWRGHLGHLGEVWVWETAERRVGGASEVEVEAVVAVCVVWAVVAVAVVGGGSSVGKLWERGAVEGETGAEVAVGCVGWRQSWSLVTRLELRWCVRRLRALPNTGYDSPPLSHILPWGTSPPRSITHRRETNMWFTDWTQTDRMAPSVEP